MKIRDIFLRKKFTLSFEIFPPKRDGNLEELFSTISELVSFIKDEGSFSIGAAAKIVVSILWLHIINGLIIMMIFSLCSMSFPSLTGESRK